MSTSPEMTSFQDVLKLIELIKSSSNFSEIRLRTGDIEVELRRHGAPRVAADASLPAATAPTPVAVSTTPAPAPTPAAPQAPAARRSVAPREGARVVTSPMVGTAYRAPEPGAAPFVAVGQSVRAGQQLCIVEVMKLMNAISTDADGVVEEILFEDGEAVQHDQPLFVIATR